MHNYVIALYIRLSVEDFKTESLSIPNQKLILREKAMSDVYKRQDRYYTKYYSICPTGIFPTVTV